MRPTFRSVTRTERPAGRTAVSGGYPGGGGGPATVKLNSSIRITSRCAAGDPTGLTSFVGLAVGSGPAGPHVAPNTADSTATPIREPGLAHQVPTPHLDGGISGEPFRAAWAFVRTVTSTPRSRPECLAHPVQEILERGLSDPVEQRAIESPANGAKRRPVPGADRELGPALSEGRDLQVRVEGREQSPRSGGRPGERQNGLGRDTEGGSQLDLDFLAHSMIVDREPHLGQPVRRAVLGVPGQ